MSTDADQEFSAAFAEAAGADPLVFDDPPAAPETPEAPEAPEAPETPLAPAADDAPAEPEVTPEEPAAPVEEVAAAPAAPAEPEEDVMQVYERLQKIMYGEPPAPAAETPAEEAPNPERAAEEERLAAIRKDWPEVDQLLQATVDRTRAELEARFNDNLSRLRQEIEPVVQTTRSISQEQYNLTIRAAHPDTQEIIAPLVRWIDKQPDYLKTAYVRAYNSPNPADAIDLINRYKADAGITKQPTPDPEAQRKAVEKKQNLQLLKQPGSRRTGVVSSADPADFEGAFAEAAERFDKVAR
jgi:hypothetical protein